MLGFVVNLVVNGVSMGLGVMVLMCMFDLVSLMVVVWVSVLMVVFVVL